MGLGPEKTLLTFSVDPEKQILDISLTYSNIVSVFHHFGSGNNAWILMKKVHLGGWYLWVSA